jgi:hypothetical protein
VSVGPGRFLFHSEHRRLIQIPTIREGILSRGVPGGICALKQEMGSERLSRLPLVVFVGMQNPQMFAESANS